MVTSREPIATSWGAAGVGDPLQRYSFADVSAARQDRPGATTGREKGIPEERRLPIVSQRGGVTNSVDRSLKCLATAMDWARLEVTDMVTSLVSLRWSVTAVLRLSGGWRLASLATFPLPADSCWLCSPLFWRVGCWKRSAGDYRGAGSMGGSV